MTCTNFPHICSIYSFSTALPISAIGNFVQFLRRKIFDSSFSHNSHQCIRKSCQIMLRIRPPPCCPRLAPASWLLGSLYYFPPGLLLRFLSLLRFLFQSAAGRFFKNASDCVPSLFGTLWWLPSSFSVKANPLFWCVRLDP